MTTGEQPPMPYLIHFLDDTDDKPQELSEKDARTVIWGKFSDARMRQLRWQQLEQGERVYVSNGYLGKEEKGTP